MTLYLVQPPNVWVRASDTFDVPTPTPDYCTIEAAAIRMSTTPLALAKRCQRNARRNGTADLGGGILGVKVGHLWRIKFPPEK